MRHEENYGELYGRLRSGLDSLLRFLDERRGADCLWGPEMDGSKAILVTMDKLADGWTVHYNCDPMHGLTFTKEEGL
jgi:hypothetical protein